MKSKKLTLGLLIFYLVALTWIIVLKMQFPFSGNLPELRNINLIPFGGSLIVNGEVSFSEIIKNVLVFIPFGILISLLVVLLGVLGLMPWWVACIIYILESVLVLFNSQLIIRM
mgnify:CR=1 FL=1